jgi:hypothetical protein
MTSHALVPIFGLVLCSYILQVQGIKTEYTPQEKAALAKMRPLIEESLTQDYMKEDIFLLKFLRAKKLNVDDALDSLRQTLKWRKENNIDNLLSVDLSEVFKKNPYDIDGVDKEGGPVVIIPFTNDQWDIRKYTVSGQRQVLTRHWDQMLEKIALKLRQLGNSSTIREDVKGILIMDISGHNVRQHACLTCLPLYLEWMQHTESHYPQNFKKLYLINAPRAFSPLLAILKPAMQPSTRDLLNSYGANKKEWSTEFLKLIPADQLPPEYGGTRKSSKL